MADNNKPAIREIPKHDIHVKASTKERSVLRELGKGAMEEVIIPKSRETMRNMSDDIFTMILEVLRSLRDGILYPDGNIPHKSSPNSTGVYTGTTNYTSFSTPINKYQPSSPKGRDLIGQRPGNEVKYVWVWTEEDAKRITGTLREDIENYGKVKVAVLYEMIKERTTMSDFTFGWTDANAIGYHYDGSRRADEPKWFIDLPKPVDITNC